MQIRSLIDARAELTGGAANDCPVVLSTRLRLARNLQDTPFPGWAKASQRRDTLARCLDAIRKLPQMAEASVFELEELSDLERQILVERHLISRELAENAEGSGVVISKDQSCSIMINEEDHLRIQMVRSGFHLEKLWKAVDGVDSALEEHLDFAFQPDYGYLTACPTNLGTALRASAMMHLPALVLSGQMEKVVRAVNQLGIAVRGLFGEGSDASGSVFQISNQQTLGESEEEITRRLVHVLNAVIHQENNARQKLLEKDAVKIFDKIGRAYGILRNGHLISSAEVMNLLSLMRLAIDLKALDEKYRPLIDRFLVESQPGHIQFAADREIAPEERDIQRAAHLRTHLQDLPPLNFSQVTPAGA